MRSDTGVGCLPQLANATHAADINPAARQLNILLATGDDDGGRRATLAFSAACSARAMGYEVMVFLVGDGMCWALDGHADYFHAAGYPPLNQLIDNYLSGGGQLYKCSNPVEAYRKQRSLESQQCLRNEVRLMGFTSFIDRLGGSNAITF